MKPFRYQVLWEYFDKISEKIKINFLLFIDSANQFFLFILQNDGNSITIR